jgi:hypothetical protein
MTINMYFKRRNTSFFPRGYSTSSSSRTQKGQNVNKKKRTTAILTDTPVKNALKKNYNTRLGAILKNWAQDDRKETRVQHF